MEFLKKSDAYLVQHTKIQAVKGILKDHRTKSVKMTKNCMIIITNPIMPECTKFQKLVLAPIGTYVIILKKTNNYIYIKINRKQKKILKSYVHPHANVKFDGGTICWGSAANEIDTICENNDWYWAGIMSLNLLKDFNDNNIKNIELLSMLLKAQIQYKKTKQFRTELLDKAEKFILKDEALTDVAIYEYEYNSIEFKQKLERKITKKRERRDRKIEKERIERMKKIRLILTKKKKQLPDKCKNCSKKDSCIRRH